MGMFIRVNVDREQCNASRGCSGCVSVCPVDILRLERGELTVDPENEDECTLCDLCLEACGFNALRIERLYLEAAT